MKRIRILSIIYCVAAIALFVVYQINERSVLDNDGPVITMDSDTIEISVWDDNDMILSGVTAYDDRDGDTTELLVVEKVTNFMESGRRQATIAAFDKAGNVTKKQRQVLYTDYEAPRFAVTAPFYFPVNVTSIERYITASDQLDGNITSRIRLSSEEGITLSKAGVYQVIFTVSNSAGDTVKLPVTVDIYETAERAKTPSILLDEYLIYIEKGAEFEPEDYIKKVSYSNRAYVRTEESGALHYDGQAPANLGETLLLRDIEIDNPVNTEVPGVYEVTYSYSWQDSMPGTTRLIVVIEE